DRRGRGVVGQLFHVDGDLPTLVERRHLAGGAVRACSGIGGAVCADGRGPGQPRGADLRARGDDEALRRVGGTRDGAILQALEHEDAAGGAPAGMRGPSPAGSRLPNQLRMTNLLWESPKGNEGRKDQLTELPPRMVTLSEL